MAKQTPSQMGKQESYPAFSEWLRSGEAPDRLTSEILLAACEALIRDAGVVEEYSAQLAGMRAAIAKARGQEVSNG
jgi:hypothetical protein